MARVLRKQVRGALPRGCVHRRARAARGRDTGGRRARGPHPHRTARGRGSAGPQRGGVGRVRQDLQAALACPPHEVRLRGDPRQGAAPGPVLLPDEGHAQLPAARGLPHADGPEQHAPAPQPAPANLEEHSAADAHQAGRVALGHLPPAVPRPRRDGCRDRRLQAVQGEPVDPDPVRVYQPLLHDVLLHVAHARHRGAVERRARGGAARRAPEGGDPPFLRGQRPPAGHPGRVQGRCQREPRDHADRQRRLPPRRRAPRDPRGGVR
mmetsp:Transcript_65458/g.184331  ORF Transcript_65458/g.184331 Transcript_65458/m.184331 type:complete len:266 (-) Transcript_65458:439-1236(-)